MIPALVNGVPFHPSRQAVEPCDRSFGFFPVPVGGGRDRTGAHGCAAEAAPHASPGILGYVLRNHGFEVEISTETEIGFEEGCQRRAGQIAVAIFHVVKRDEIPFKDLVQMSR